MLAKLVKTRGISLDSTDHLKIKKNRGFISRRWRGLKVSVIVMGYSHLQDGYCHCMFGDVSLSQLAQLIAVCT